MKTPRVLIVEDDPDLISDLPPLLDTYDIKAVAVSPEESEKQMKQGAFDCIVLDLKMPPLPDMTDEETDFGRLTGVVIGKRLREIDPNVPMLVLTSISDPKAHALAREVGADCVLEKPTYPDELVQQIKLLVR